jgi:hypothetical protein
MSLSKITQSYLSSLFSLVKKIGEHRKMKIVSQMCHITYTLQWIEVKLTKLGRELHYLLVVYRSSETSTNQSDVIIRSADRFLNLVVDSDSIVSKIYMLNFVLWLFFWVSILTKILQFYPRWFFLPSYWQTSGSFVQADFWHSVNTHMD